MTIDDLLSVFAQLVLNSVCAGNINDGNGTSLESMRDCSQNLYVDDYYVQYLLHPLDFVQVDRLKKVTLLALAHIGNTGGNLYSLQIGHYRKKPIG